MYSDPLLMVAILILLATTGASALYYRRIRRAHEEYEKARGVVADVIVSFNRQLQRQEGRLGVVAQKTDVLSFESEKVARKVEEYDGRLVNLANKIEAVSRMKQKVSEQIEEMDKRLDEAIATQKRIMEKIAKVEKLGYKVPVPEAKIEAAIPIKKERALAPLTETELSVLEILANEGRKTAPEIRDRIKLTREHTARLMKKLYEDGYLERETQKLPYAYRIKEEMLKILKKREAKA